MNVTGAFNSGGAQNDNFNRNRIYQLGDTLRWAARPKLNLQSGVEGNYERRHSVSRNNFLGVYTFASLDDYVAGRPQTFTQNSGNPLLDSQQYDFNAFVQADWRAARNVSVGLGARYIAQSNLRDYNNVAPTVSVAVQAARKTVFRAGSRFSYQTFALANTETILRNSGGATQTVLNIAFPTYIAGQAPPEAVRASSMNAGSIYIRSSRLEAPYNINSSHQSRTGFAQRLEVRSQRWIQPWRTPDPNAQHQCAIPRHAVTGRPARPVEFFRCKLQDCGSHGSRPVAAVLPAGREHLSIRIQCNLVFKEPDDSVCTLRRLDFPAPLERCIWDILHSAAPLPTREATATTISAQRPTSTTFRGSGPVRKTINGIGSRPNSKSGPPRLLDS